MPTPCGKGCACRPSLSGRWQQPDLTGVKPGSGPKALIYLTRALPKPRALLASIMVSLWLVRKYYAAVAMLHRRGIAGLLTAIFFIQIYAGCLTVYGWPGNKHHQSYEHRNTDHQPKRNIGKTFGS